MRPLLVIFVDKGVESGLLLEEVGACGPGRFLFEREVHALVTAILLRPTWLDALDIDTETQPPDRHFGQIVEPVRRCEGNAIVGANCFGDTALAEELLEDEDMVLDEALEDSVDAIFGEDDDS